MKLLAKIDSRIIQEAIQRATPLTANGRNAIENYRRFLLTNPMTASGLEASIATLVQMNDAGLENFINVLKGLMPTSKRRVAVAYEMIQFERSDSVFKVGVEAEAALAELYRFNAAKIIDEINKGALDQYKTNPNIANLISYAKSAIADQSRIAPLPISDSESVQYRLVPVINIASLGDAGMLVSIDGNLFVDGQRGGLSKVADFSSIENIPDDVRLLIRCMSLVKLDDQKPNVVNLESGLADVAKKILGINEFAIDLLGSYDDFVTINKVSMSAEKAKLLIDANRDSIISNIVVSESGMEAVKLITTMIDVFDRYRGTLLSGAYAHRFTVQDVNFYIIRSRGFYSTIAVMNNTVISATKYNGIYELLADENVITSTELHDRISVVFKDELQSEVNRSSVKQNLLNKLLNERNEYEDLLKRIHANQTELAELSDANPEKVKQLDEIEKKVAGSLKAVNDEIEKMTK